MKGFALGLAVGAAAAATASAVALPGSGSVPLRTGDSAYAQPSRSGTPTCTAVTRAGVPSLRCYVTDSPTSKANAEKRFSVVINGTELNVTQYFGPNRAEPYKLIFHRIQTETFIGRG